MELQTLETYLPHMQHLSCQLSKEPSILQEILESIQNSQQSATEDSSLQEFFKGEYAFYQGQYERALNHYLNAKEVLHFEFFCYRASAYVFQAKDENEKALKFINKALDIYPEDCLAKEFLKELSETPDPLRRDRLNIHQNTLHEKIENEEESHLTEDALKSEPKILFSGKEMDGLAGIFETTSSEDLFSFEPWIDGTPSDTEDAELDSAKDQLFSEPLSPDHLQLKESTMKTETSVCAEPCRTDSTLQDLLTEKPDSNASESFSQPTSSNEIDQAIESFYHLQSVQLLNYLEKWLKHSAKPDFRLQIFQGWSAQSGAKIDDSSNLDTLPLTYCENLTEKTGGLYLRWNNKGIVINPGNNFLNRFHNAGLHVKDIDIIIATHGERDTYADIQEIYELNFRLNRASGDQQIIHYYLNQKIYQELSTTLKPHSKQERNAIHCLEFFAESPELEQVDLGEGMILHYFSTQPQAPLSQSFSRSRQTTSCNLGIKLELPLPQNAKKASVSFGYISGVSWSPFIGQHLTNCDILLAGIGNTNHSDYNKIVHLDDGLGYYGICSLLEDTLPKLFLCTEFGTRDGDLRLELIKKMRVEYSDQMNAILPADIGMSVDLKTLQITCSMTGQLVDPKEIRVVRSHGLFGPLQYLAPSCCL